MQPEIPEKVRAAIKALQEGGISAWVIGGAVRDSLLGRPVHDWDLTAAGTPEQIAAALPQAKPIGGVYGTVSWHGVEITPCRAESDYTDHRHPETIAFGADLRADLSRRDFTVNAMAWDGETVIDPYHGRFDLADGILRCVGEPEQRFAEDALRILRLYRFAATLGFSMEQNTEKAALRLADTLCVISAPRVRGELSRALAGPHPAVLAPLLATGTLSAFGLGADALRETGSAALAALDAVPPVALCRWWALFRLSGSDAFRAAKVFEFGRSFQKEFAKLDEWFAEGMPKDRHALKLLLMEGEPVAFADAASTFAAVSPAFEELPGMYAALCASGEPYQKEHLRITPAELLTEGVPGRRIGEVQRCLVKAVVDTPALNVWPTLAEMARGLRFLV